jgi:hypothetical protein
VSVRVVPFDAVPGSVAGSRVVRPVWALATVEARAYLRSIPLWLGFALAGAQWLFTDLAQERWVGSQYTDVVGMAPATAYVGVFVAATLIGLRDRMGQATPLSSVGPVDPGTVASARLLGGLVPVALIVVMLSAGVVWLDQRGGIVVGGVHVLPQPADLVLIPVLVGLAVATGIAAAQLVRSRAVVVGVGSLVILLTTVTSWMFGAADAFLPAPYAPRTVDLGAGFDTRSAPAGWRLVAPDSVGEHWRRSSFEQAAVGWHIVYVVGLLALLVAVVQRVHGRRAQAAALAAGGLVACVIGGVLQVVARTGPWV